jgi:ASC-1-like (ASCH) protein
MPDIVQEIHCQEPWFGKIRQGIKTVEGRKYSAKYSQLGPGDMVRFYCDNDSYLVEIVKLVRYATLEEYLLAEGFEKAGCFLAIHLQVID